MKTSIRIVGPLLVCMAANAQGGPPVVEVHGHGTWTLETGDAHENHQPVIDSTSINAWMNEDGSVEGTIVWTGAYNGFGCSGQACSGWPWQIEVDTLIVYEPNAVYLAGTVVHSVIESEIGSRTSWYLRDNGYKIPDQINGGDVIAGNFTIRMR